MGPRVVQAELAFWLYHVVVTFLFFELRVKDRAEGKVGPKKVHEVKNNTRTLGVGVNIEKGGTQKFFMAGQGCCHFGAYLIEHV